MREGKDNDPRYSVDVADVSGDTGSASNVVEGDAGDEWCYAS